MDNPIAELVVIDDDPAAQRGVAALATSLGIRCQTYSSAEEFLSGGKRPTVGCLLIDLRLGGMSGVDLIERLQSDKCDIPMILISAYADVPTTVRAMKRGALTLIEKPYRADELADAIRSAIARSIQIRDASDQRQCVQRAIATLTAREKGAMELIIQGRANKSVARELDISLRTVDRVRASIIEKMGAESAVDVARMVSELRGFERAQAMQRGEKAANPPLPAESAASAPVTPEATSVQEPIWSHRVSDANGF